MLHFFTDPYEDELMSSVFARYHFYSDNIDKNDTIEELQGERNITAFRVFPSRLKFLEGNLNNNYTADNLIYKNTIFPVYSVFLSRDKHTDIINHMKYKETDKIYNVLGISTSKVDVRKNFRYCPLCAQSEKELYGEAYFHVIHQVPGVLVCEKHECRLFDYIDEYKSEIEFIRLEYDNIRFKKATFYEKKINDVLFQIAISVKYIKNLEYLKYNREFILEKFYKLLDEKGYLTEHSKIRQTKLIADFKNYYEEKMLKILNSEVDSNNGKWIKEIFTYVRYSSQPVRTILLILFLTNNNIIDFFCEKNEKKLEFIQGPWPCLNPVCHYYKKDVINDIKTEKAYKSRLTNAIFKCKYCGYTYRRKGPDKDNTDRCKKDKVLEFGPLWEREFKKAIVRRDKKKDIIEQFQVYYKFIDYYVKNNEFITRDYKTNSGNIQDNFEEYTNAIEIYMKKNKGCIRSDICKYCSKQVGWLRYNHQEWLDKNMPKAKVRKSYSIERNYEKFDTKLLERVKGIYNELIMSEKHRRITITLIERQLNEKISRKVDKLPKTKVYLDKVLENVNQYSVRAVRDYCNNLMKEDIYMAKTIIITRTAISYSLISDKCKKDICTIIDEYHRLIS